MALNSTTVIILVVLAGVAIFLIFLVYWIYRCWNARHPIPVAVYTSPDEVFRAIQETPSDNKQANDVLRQKIIDKFHRKLRKNKQTSPPDMNIKNKRWCPICLSHYRGLPEQVLVGYLKACSHYYHFDCIWKWLEHKGSCPMCREAVKLVEGEIQGLPLSKVTHDNKKDESKGHGKDLQDFQNVIRNKKSTDNLACLSDWGSEDSKMEKPTEQGKDIHNLHVIQKQQSTDNLQGMNEGSEAQDTRPQGSENNEHVSRVYVTVDL